MSAFVGLAVWAVILMLGLWVGRRLRVFRDGMDARHGSGWAK